MWAASAVEHITARVTRTSPLNGFLGGQSFSSDNGAGEYWASALEGALFGRLPIYEMACSRGITKNRGRSALFVQLRMEFHRAPLKTVRRSVWPMGIFAAIVTRTGVGSKLLSVLVGVAQLVERRTVAPNVVGSNPIAHPNSLSGIRTWF
jgi:hypothetical protein